MEIVNLDSSTEPTHQKAYAHPIKSRPRSTTTQHHLKRENRFLFIFMSILPEMCDSFGLSPSDWLIFYNYSA